MGFNGGILCHNGGVVQEWSYINL